MKIVLTSFGVLHLGSTLWHGSAHSAIDIQLSGLQNLYVFAVVLTAPVVGVALLWSRFRDIGVWLFAISMVGACLFGVYYHYILVSPDNIAHLPAASADAHTQFIRSAAVIAVVEFVSALLGFFALGQAYPRGRRLPSES